VSGRVHGLVLAEVLAGDDPSKQGRVKLRLVARPGDAESQWAPIARPLASGGFGLWFQPAEGDIVVVGFEDGRIERPYVLGAIFTGDNDPPVAENKQRMIRSEAGHQIVLDDTSGSEAVVIRDRNDNVLTMDSTGITIESTSDVTIKGVNVTIEAQAQLTGVGSPIHLNP
jgi:uncharacterized protein involved in type VI secretion and phage assembly